MTPKEICKNVGAGVILIGFFTIWFAIFFGTIKLLITSIFIILFGAIVYTLFPITSEEKESKSN